MSRRSRRKPPPAPDGELATPVAGGSSPKSKVSDVQDPLIAGDVKKAGNRAETDEATVDEAGQIRRKGSEVDLLH
jgi:hypothetical protein